MSLSRCPSEARLGTCVGVRVWLTGWLCLHVCVCVRSRVYYIVFLFTAFNWVTVCTVVVLWVCIYLLNAIICSNSSARFCQNQTHSYSLALISRIWLSLLFHLVSHTKSHIALEPRICYVTFSIYSYMFSTAHTLFRILFTSFSPSFCLTFFVVVGCRRFFFFFYFYSVRLLIQLTHTNMQRLFILKHTLSHTHQHIKSTHTDWLTLAVMLNLWLGKIFIICWF